jgi:hypothetical protein
VGEARGGGRLGWRVDRLEGAETEKRARRTQREKERAEEWIGRCLGGKSGGLALASGSSWRSGLYVTFPFPLLCSVQASRCDLAHLTEAHLLIPITPLVVFAQLLERDSARRDAGLAGGWGE